MEHLKVMLAGEDTFKHLTITIDLSQIKSSIIRSTGTLKYVFRGIY